MSTPDSPSGAPWRNFYGRRHGKTLRDRHRDFIAHDLQDLKVPGVDWDENPERLPLDPGTLFPDARETWLEIGFGGGEHMVHMAATYRDVGIVGCEPFINGVAMLIGKVRKAGVSNLAIHPGDVRDLFDILPEGSVARAFLLYPDPWPKTRHHRRRFVTPEHLEPLARVMRPGAVLRVATDIPDYVRQTLKEVPRHGFDLVFASPTDWLVPWDDWTSTRYEQKALREGRVPQYLTFRRV
jgi:tRNA (guanine-N7-)-methyltransferase